MGSPRSSAIRVVRGVAFLGARGAEDVAQAVVAFVALVLRSVSLSFSVSGIENVHGRVHVVGSSIVTDQRTLSGAIRVNRSVSFSVSGLALR